jgi:hypothetical protein
VPPYVLATATLRGVTVTADGATGGAGGASHGSGQPGNPGKGVGGGLYISLYASQVGLDAFTVGHVTNNQASTSDNDIYGPYSVIV